RPRNARSRGRGSGRRRAVRPRCGPHRHHHSRSRPALRGDRMTTSIERAGTRRPVTWLTIGGVALLPALIGGILVASLNNPTERRDNMSAAIGNLDEGTEIGGQLAPLGRQRAAGLVEGSDDVDSNIDWVLSNKDDASDGIDNGTYEAVITIPEGFSDAAMSSANAIQGSATPEQATIEVSTSDDARIFDQAIMQQISSI